jgi:nicotinamidase-related amidase
MSPEVQKSVLPKIKTLLTKARASGIPVIYIQHDGPKGIHWRPIQKAGNFHSTPILHIVSHLGGLIFRSPTIHCFPMATASRSIFGS